MNNRRGFLANIAGVGLSLPLINKVTPASAREISEFGKPSLQLKPYEDEEYTYIRVKKIDFLGGDPFVHDFGLKWVVSSMHESFSLNQAPTMTIDLIGRYDLRGKS